jgi:hypothetical protein
MGRDSSSKRIDRKDKKAVIALVLFAFIGYHWFLEIEALFIRK